MNSSWNTRVLWRRLPQPFSYFSSSSNPLMFPIFQRNNKKSANFFQTVVQLRSVVFRWLRNELSGKRFSYTRLGVWVLVCGGLGHMVRQGCHFLLPFVITWLLPTRPLFAVLIAVLRGSHLFFTLYFVRPLSGLSFFRLSVVGLVS